MAKSLRNEYPIEWLMTLRLYQHLPEDQRNEMAEAECRDIDRVAKRDAKRRARRNAR